MFIYILSYLSNVTTIKIRFEAVFFNFDGKNANDIVSAPLKEKFTVLLLKHFVFSNINFHKE